MVRTQIYFICIVQIFMSYGAQAAETLFESAFNKHHAIMLLIEPVSGDIIAANPAASKFYGYPAAQLNSMKIQQINALPSETVADERILAAKENRNAFIFRHQLANGELRTVEVSSTPIDYRGQQVLFSIIRDISEFRKTENALWHYQNRLEDMVITKTAQLEAQQRHKIIQMSIAILLLLLLAIALTLALYRHKHTETQLALKKQRLDEVIWGTDVGTWEWHIPSGRVYINARWAEIVGYTLDELESDQPGDISINTWFDLCHKKDLAKSSALLEQHFSGQSDYYECELRMRHKFGHWVWILDRGKIAVRDKLGNPVRMSGTHQDISEQKRLYQQLEQQAHYDQLTQLPNRVLFYDRFQQLIRTSERKASTFAVFFVDLDGFKIINDNYGHKTGDKVLIEAAARMKRTVRRSDIVARLGGDEFAILLQDIQDGSAVEKLCNSIMKTIREPYQVAEATTVNLSCSIGISLYPEHAVNIDALITHADTAMYRAKKSGKDQACFATDSSDWLQ